MQTSPSTAHWLDHYASAEYEWREAVQDGQTTYYRPLGLVESTFDADGRHYEGRADINALLKLEVRSLLRQSELHQRILLAWTCLRAQHLLLQAKAVPISRIAQHGTAAPTTLCFAVTPLGDDARAVAEAAKRIVFLDEHYGSVDPNDFWIHCQNTSRVVDPDTCLAKLFVLPLEQNETGTSHLRLQFVGSHQIWDGLSQYIWMRDCLAFLNRSTEDLRRYLRDLLEPNGVRTRLPLPQEALYPPINGSKARQRWYWLLTRILRHVRKPLEASFPNPLTRPSPLRAVPLSPTYAAVLDYGKVPPFNSVPCSVGIQQKCTRRLHRLCREAGVSIGAGCFALAAITMMEMYEQLEPDVPLEQRKPFISGFPLDPRAFFNHRNEPNSLMLAFCDGITLPFLSSQLNLDGRIRLLARQAQRQLAVYQKRIRPKETEVDLQFMGARGAGRVLAIQYISSMERADANLPEHLRQNINVQGAYPARQNATRQTCGVSSVGRQTLLRRGMYDLADDSRNFVADFRGLTAGVRPREGEFLVGVGGSDESLGINVSVDASSVDLALMEKWKQKLESILESNNAFTTKARL